MRKHEAIIIIYNLSLVDLMADISADLHCLVSSLFWNKGNSTSMINDPERFVLRWLAWKVTTIEMTLIWDLESVTSCNFEGHVERGGWKFNHKVESLTIRTSGDTSSSKTKSLIFWASCRFTFCTRLHSWPFMPLILGFPLIISICGVGWSPEPHSAPFHCLRLGRHGAKTNRRSVRFDVWIYSFQKLFLWWLSPLPHWSLESVANEHVHGRGSSLFCGSCQNLCVQLKLVAELRVGFHRFYSLSRCRRQRNAKQVRHSRKKAMLWVRMILVIMARVNQLGKEN